MRTAKVKAAAIALRNKEYIWPASDRWPALKAAIEPWATTYRYTRPFRHRDEALEALADSDDLEEARPTALEIRRRFEERCFTAPEGDGPYNRDFLPDWEAILARIVEEVLDEGEKWRVFRHFSEEEADDRPRSASGRHVEAVNEAWLRWGPEGRAQMLREYGRAQMWEGEVLVENQGFPWWAPKETS